MVVQPGVISPNVVGSWAKFISHPGVRYWQPLAPCAISSPFRSVQLSDADCRRIGLSAAATPLVADSTNLLALNFTAVLPVPNTSEVTEKRGSKFFHGGIFSGPNVRSGTKTP